jgi:hypothetical protein
VRQQARQHGLLRASLYSVERPALHCESIEHPFVGQQLLLCGIVLWS